MTKKTVFQIKVKVEKPFPMHVYDCIWEQRPTKEEIARHFHDLNKDCPLVMRPVMMEAKVSINSGRFECLEREFVESKSEYCTPICSRVF